jgi:hypothetical protein
MLFLKDLHLGNRLRAMPNWLRTMLHSAEWQLPAMPHSAGFLQKISLPTPCYATQREIQLKVFWSTPCYAAQRRVDSMLCGIARSRNSPQCATARNRHIFVNISAKSKPNLKIFYDANRWPKGSWLVKKTESRKSRETETVPLMFMCLLYICISWHIHPYSLLLCLHMCILKIALPTPSPPPIPQLNLGQEPKKIVMYSTGTGIWNK